MNKKILKTLLVLVAPISLVGCAHHEEPITNKDESTIIKNVTNTDEYLKNKDYKSIAYTYIYNIKDGLNSYESETNGSIKAKVLFFDYNIKYWSVTHKKGSAFYSKDDSTSTLMNVQNEFYMVDRDKILVSRDLQNYDVYAMEDYKKVSYAVNQYTIMGYVFNDESIVNAELLSDNDDNVSIKYILDNDKATNLVKVDLKTTGGLSTYPTFNSIEITLSMKRDFTPISYEIHTIYEASKAVLGSSKVTQEGKCLFSKVNEDITIPNEEVLQEKLGAKPSEIIIDEEEQKIKDDLLNSLKRLDYKHGVNVAGNLKITIPSAETKLDISSNFAFDTERLATEKLFDVFSFYAKFDSDEYFGSLLTLVMNILGDKIGEVGKVLQGFHSLEAVYDGEGSIILIPTNEDGVQTMVYKLKITDLLDIILKNVNLYNLINGAKRDFANFERIDGKDENNYQVVLTLTDETKQTIKEKLNEIIESPDYGTIVKMILNYKDFDDVRATFDIVDGVIHSVDASFNYFQPGTEEEGDISTPLVSIYLEAKNETFDFDSKIQMAKETNEKYQSVQELKVRIEELLNNIYVSNGYVSKVDATLAEYRELDEVSKGFLDSSYEERLIKAKEDVLNVMEFISFIKPYDLDNLTNKEILEIAKAYKSSLPYTLLKAELGEETVNKLSNLADLVDYSALDSNISKFVGDDEFAWELSSGDIVALKELVDIGNSYSGVQTQILFKLITGSVIMDYTTFEAKITNLYNSLDA